MKLKYEYTEEDLKNYLENGEYGDHECAVDDPCHVLLCGCSICKDNAGKCDPKALYDKILSEGITITLRKKKEK
jgi:hypothetical protein